MWWQLLGVLAGVGPAGFVAAAGVLLATLLTVRALIRGVAVAHGPRVIRRLLREQATTAVPRHRDPDARGRSRPRAPTAALAAA
jgi:hypothetical protein